MILLIRLFEGKKCKYEQYCALDTLISGKSIDGISFQFSKIKIYMVLVSMINYKKLFEDMLQNVLPWGIG